MKAIYPYYPSQLAITMMDGNVKEAAYFERGATLACQARANDPSAYQIKIEAISAFIFGVHQKVG